MKRNNLIAYAQCFASFLIDADENNEINNIILFGSVAKNQFDEESDIDIFVDTAVSRDKIIKQFRLFEDSHMAKVWHSKGIEHSISLHIGQLKNHNIRESVISSGIQIYGKFKQMPEKIDYYYIFVLDFCKLSRNEKVSIWRKLYGYKQIVNRKKYESKGIISNLNGKRIEKNIILIPAENKNRFINHLSTNKIQYVFYESWIKM